MCIGMIKWVVIWQGMWSLNIEHSWSYTDRTRIDMFHALHCLVCLTLSRFHTSRSIWTSLMSVIRTGCGNHSGQTIIHRLHTPIQSSTKVCTNHLVLAFQGVASFTNRISPIIIEHCIDHIRQMLMCSGDMTLIPTEWTDYLGRNYVNSDVPHTCRNFAKLRDWVVSRHNGSTMVPESSVKHHEKGQDQ